VESKPKLIALDYDLSTLRDVAAVMTPWFEVLRIREPMKAIATIESDKTIAAIITEQVLPQASGIDLLETIRTRAPGIRRVLLTGHDDLATIITGLHTGAIQALVHKPFRREELVGAVLPQGAKSLAMLRASA